MVQAGVFGESESHGGKMTDFWLLALLMYPLAGLVYYSICLLVLPAGEIRRIDSKYPPVPVFMLITVSALFWPICMARAWRQIRNERCNSGFDRRPTP
jgi:hypothetical protein